MPDEFAETKQEPARARYSRAFRPLSYWLIISAGLLAWDYHRKHAPLTTINFTVRIEGQKIENPSAYSATIGKERVGPRSVAPIGWRTFSVELPDAEPFKKSLFVWYGENEAGEIDLKWNRGVLDLKIEPKAKLVQLIGPHHSFSLTNSSGTSVSIPVGAYRVAAVFDHLSEQHQVRVGPNETNPFVIKPNLGTVSVTSEPTGATFRLSAGGRNPFSTDGDTPALLTGLPVGNYQLRAWRGDYIKEMSLNVKKWETNQVSVAFEYGEVKVVSEPDGATIWSGGKDLGQTPKTLTELKPGPYRFRLEKAGYSPTELNVELLGTNAITITTNLLSVRYAEAISSARREAGALSPDFRRALTNVELALKEKPDDAESLALKFTLETRLEATEKAATEQKQRAQIEARNRVPAQQFQNATKIYTDVALFDTYRWELKTDLSKLRAAVLRAIRKTSIKWAVGEELKLDNNTFVLHCTPSGFLTLGRRCSILASEVTPGDVHVYAKFWDYAPAGGALITDKFIPVHKSYFKPEEAVSIEQRRRAIAENFYQMLQTELR